MKELKISRWTFRRNEKTRNLSFHIFVDANQNAYAVVVFARTEGIKDVYVQLLAARSRMAPIKKTMIPRFELLAATIGVRDYSTPLKTL